MPIFRYRLAVLVTKKEERKQECEKHLAERRNERKEAELRLKQLQQHQETLVKSTAAVRRRLVTSPTNGADIQAQVMDLAVLDQKTEDAKDEVFSRRMHLEELHTRVEQAVAELAEAAREVETLHKHREQSEKAFRAGMERQETNEQEEIAAAMFETRRSDSRRRS